MDSIGYKTAGRTLLLSAGSVAVAILLLAYSAYGWMSMSREVSVSGMNVKISVPQNLQIAVPTESENFSNSLDFSFSKVVEAKLADTAKPFDTENDEFFLLPASSLDGTSVWKTDAANSDGSAPVGSIFEDVSAEYVKYRNESDSFEGYYIDIPVWLRSFSDVPLSIGLSETITNISYVESQGDEQVTKVVRMAFLTENADSPSSGSSPLVFAESDTAREVVTSEVGGLEPYSFIEFADGVSESEICQIPAVDHESDIPYGISKLTLRIWIEGQDSSCVSAITRSKFGINIGFVVKSGL